MIDIRQNDATEAVQSDPILQTDGLTKRFGGVVAVDDVDLAVEQGELHAIIGPNGAGKTTLFDTVTGALPPTAGTVWFDGEEITDLPQEARPHRGLARSFQSNQLFNDLSVLENVRVVVQTAQTGTFSLDLLGEGQDRYRDRAFDHQSGSVSTTSTAQRRRTSHTATSAGSASRLRWRRSRRSSCSTSRPAASVPRRRRRQPR